MVATRTRVLALAFFLSLCTASIAVKCKDHRRVVSVTAEGVVNEICNGAKCEEDPKFYSMPSCVSCQRDEHSIERGGNSGCTKCPTGTTGRDRGVKGKNTCNTLLGGYVRNGNGGVKACNKNQVSQTSFGENGMKWKDGKSACFTCPQNSSPSEDRTKCVCNAGYSTKIQMSKEKCRQLIQQKFNTKNDHVSDNLEGGWNDAPPGCSSNQHGGSIHYNLKANPTKIPSYRLEWYVAQHYMEGMTCHRCPSSHYAKPGKSECKRCPFGTSPKQDACVCPEGFRIDHDGRCKECPKDHYMDETSELSTVQHHRGDHLSFVSKKCSRCPEGKTTNGKTKQTTCVTCREGETYTRGRCKPCGKNTFSQNGVCKECPIRQHTQAQTGQTKCQDCPQGKFRSGQDDNVCSGVCASNKWVGGRCEKCPRGKGYDKTSTNVNKCIVCKEGKYSSIKGDTCESCPQGSDTGGKKGQGQCICRKDGHGPWKDGVCPQCPKNTISKKGATCLKCPKGKSQPKTGQTRCVDCPLNSYNDKDGGDCVQCKQGELTHGKGQTSCVPAKEYIDHMVTKITKTVEGLQRSQGDIINVVAKAEAKASEVKEASKGLVMKLQRQHATRDVRLAYDREIRKSLSSTGACAEERRGVVSVLSAIRLEMDEEIDARTCASKNRDLLVASFCNFRRSLENHLAQQGVRVNGRSLWPNICCKEDSFDNLKSCDDPSGKVERSKIVPFALAQGGAFTEKNLRGELVDILKDGGHLHKGLQEALSLANGGSTLESTVNKMFQGTNLCGPRVFHSPFDTQIHYCELLYPYGHVLGTFFESLTSLSLKKPAKGRRRLLALSGLLTKLMKARGQSIKGSVPPNLMSAMKTKRQIPQMASKLTKLEQESAVEKKALAAIKKENSALKAQMASAAGSTITPFSSSSFCPAVTMDSIKELEKMKKLFCRGYYHIDLQNDNVLNFAFVHIGKKEIEHAKLRRLVETGRYKVDDECRFKLFSPKDISIQQIGSDSLFVVQLDSASKEGYLRKELPTCGTTADLQTPRIPRTKVSVKLFEDTDECCKESKDYDVCKAKKCPVNNLNHGHTRTQMEYIFEIRGSTFEVQLGHKSSRRRLLSRRIGSSKSTVRYKSHSGGC